MTEAPVAIVTAAGKGMGAAIARELHARGWRLALLSPSGRAEALAAELGGVGVTGSITESKDLETLVNRTIEAYGRIDGLAVSTGHAPKGSLLAIPDADWHRGLDLVILSVVRLLRLVTPVMERQGAGAVVTLSTFSAFEPSLRFPVSSTLRAGLASFVKLYADEVAAKGIRINNVMPGFIDSINQGEETIAAIPMKRLGRVEEIARTVAFLLSPDAGYITGQSLRVDGGITRSV